MNAGPVNFINFLSIAAIKIHSFPLEWSWERCRVLNAAKFFFLLLRFKLVCWKKFNLAGWVKERVYCRGWNSASFQPDLPNQERMNEPGNLRQHSLILLINSASFLWTSWRQRLVCLICWSWMSGIHRAKTFFPLNQPNKQTISANSSVWFIEGKWMKDDCCLRKLNFGISSVSPALERMKEAAEWK